MDDDEMIKLTPEEVEKYGLESIKKLTPEEVEQYSLESPRKATQEELIQADIISAPDDGATSSIASTALAVPDALFSLARSFVAFPIQLGATIFAGTPPPEAMTQTQINDQYTEWLKKPYIERARDVQEPISQTINKFTEPFGEGGKELLKPLEELIEWAKFGTGSWVADHMEKHGTNRETAEAFGAVAGTSIEMIGWILGIKAIKSAGTFPSIPYKGSMVPISDLVKLKVKGEELKTLGLTDKYTNEVLKEIVPTAKAGLISEYKETLKTNRDLTQKLVDMDKAVKEAQEKLPNANSQEQDALNKIIEENTKPVEAINREIQANNQKAQFYQMLHRALLYTNAAEIKAGTQVELTKTLTEAYPLTVTAQESKASLLHEAAKEKPSTTESVTPETQVAPQLDFHKINELYRALHEKGKEIRDTAPRTAEQSKKLREEYRKLKDEYEKAKMIDQKENIFTATDAIDTRLTKEETMLIDQKAIDAEVRRAQEYGDATIQAKTLFNEAKNKQFDVSINVDKSQAVVYTIKDKLNNTEKVFTTLEGASNYTKRFRRDTIPDKNYYDVLKDEIDKASSLVGDLKGKEPLTNLDIDWVAPIKKNESVPQPRPELVYNLAEVKNAPYFQARIVEHFPTDVAHSFGISRVWRPAFALVQRIEARTGLPFFNTFMKLQDGIRKEHIISIPYLKELAKSFKGIDYGGRERAYLILEEKGIAERDITYGQFKTLVKDHDTLKFASEKEFNAAKNTSKILNEAGLAFGIPYERILKDYAPRIREKGITYDEAIQAKFLPEEMRWFAEEERTGYLKPHEMDLFKVAHTYIARGARKYAIGDQVTQMTQLIKEGMKNYKLKEVEVNTLESIIAEARGYPAMADKWIEPTAKNIAVGLNKLIDTMTLGKAPKRYKNIMYEPYKSKTGEKTLGIVGEKPGFLDVQNAMGDLLQLHLTLTYAGALGFRAAACIRNFAQTLLTVMPLVPKTFAHGVRKALTPSGIREAKAAGILLDDYLPLPSDIEKGSVTKIGKIAEISLSPYTAVDNLNRTIAYHAMKKNVMDKSTAYLEAVRNATSTNEVKLAKEKFIKDTDIEFFHPVLIKNEILPLLKNLDMEGIAQRMGKHMADQTQWVYRRANAPMFCRGKVGKVFGQFGTWSAWYLDYLQSLSTRGSKSNIAKRLAGVAVVNSGIAWAGTNVFGVNLDKWVWQHPISWSGGIATNVLQNLYGLTMDEQAAYDDSKAQKAIVNGVGLHIPGYLAFMQVYKAAQENDFEDGIKVGLGFKPAK